MCQVSCQQLTSRHGDKTRNNNGKKEKNNLHYFLALAAGFLATGFFAAGFFASGFFATPAIVSPPPLVLYIIFVILYLYIHSVQPSILNSYSTTDSGLEP